MVLEQDTHSLLWSRGGFRVLRCRSIRNSHAGIMVDRSIVTFGFVLLCLCLTRQVELLCYPVSYRQVSHTKSSR